MGGKQHVEREVLENKVNEENGIPIRPTDNQPSNTNEILEIQ